MQERASTFNEFTFRPDQEKARGMVIDSFYGGKKRPMLQSPCAWGKTIFAAGLFSGALGKRKKAMFVVPLKSLIDQTYDKFYRAGIRDIGIIQADHPLTNFDAPIQIASAQTLERRKIPMVDLVMLDEAHLRRKLYSRWMRDPEWTKVPFIGLSGTPWSEGLAEDYDDLLIPTTSNRMLEQGLLSQYRLLAPTLAGSRPDLKNLPVQQSPDGWDYVKAPLSRRMRTKKLVCNAVETWLAKGENRPTLVFCVDRAHAKDVEEEYRNAGISTAYVDKDTDREVRKKIGEKFNAGEIRVVVSIATLIVGVDWDVRCIQWLRPTKSEILWVQGNSRGFRLAKDKDDCLVLDHSWNTNNLGNPTDIHYDFLDDGTQSTAERTQRKKKERKELFPEECIRCGYYKPAGVLKCPDCGFEARKRGNVEYLQGELVEVRPNPAKEKADNNTKQIWYSQLLWVQDQRRYNDGWAANAYRRRFEVWPRCLSRIRTPASAEVLNFVKAGIMEYHRAQKLQNEFRIAL